MGCSETKSSIGFIQTIFSEENFPELRKLKYDSFTNFVSEHQSRKSSLVKINKKLMLILAYFS